MMILTAASSSKTFHFVGFTSPPPVFSSIRSQPINKSIGIVHFSQFTEKTSFNLSSSRTISRISPLLSRTLSSVNSLPKNAPSFSVIAHKGYKMKTHKASAKRFRVTGTGKIMRRRAGKQHLLRKKNTKRRVRLSKMLQVDRSDYNNVIGALPYLKVNRAN
ncbi:50S ribosomal protein L35, chloroplastic-like [Impatiens glandulifera]|uniref:50S ribosomal protein L35, chloroplastic-like n=1 Tax=Impatiens glandulifera TaxID=253017 RepID=UPI001FB0522C|nr:50S ribosomal protein L35, chloroplastic-like [Impatiens glandulifera]